MCMSPNKTLLGKTHLMMDDARTKIANKIGIPALRDFGSEWMNGKSRSIYGKAPAAAKVNSGLQIPTQT